MELKNSFISYGKQWIDEQDVQSVLDVLRSEFITQGPKVPEFEQAICRYTGAEYCVAVSSGTAALHLAVAALGIEKDMKGITSPITFVASSNAMIYSSIEPVFADIDENTFNIDVGEIEKRITDKTKLIIPVHFAGCPADMKSISVIAKEKNISVIEDAAHAIGSEYPDGGKVGNCKYSNMTIFSFHPVKTITAGEGGAITTNSKELYEKLVKLRSHGITKEQKLLHQDPGAWYYEMQSLGFNYRITDMQAALGMSQLGKLDDFVWRRREIVKKYNAKFNQVECLKIPKFAPEAAYHLYVLRIDFEKIGKSRKNVMKELREKGIGTQVHYIPVHLQPYYQQNFGYKKGNYPKAEEYYKVALSLPLYPKMTDLDQKRVLDSIFDILNINGKTDG